MSEIAKTKRGKSTILIKVASNTHFPESIGDTHSKPIMREQFVTAVWQDRFSTVILKRTRGWFAEGIPRFVLLQFPGLAFAKSSRADSELGSGNPFVLQDSNHDTAVFRL
jgi:hypothetical protein